MKKILFTTVLLASSYTLAMRSAPPEQPEPVQSIEGVWNVKSRACTSNAPINDGVKLGQDKISIHQKPDKTFEYKMNVGGCETIVTGTYVQEEKKVTYTSKTSKGCKDANPVPLNESFSTFFAYLSQSEAVTVTTGAKAAMLCPAGDALVLHFTKEGAQE